MSDIIRVMTMRDLAECERLSQVAGWNQTCVDWQRAVILEPVGCIVAERAGKIVGTLATTVFAQVARISMVLVDPEVRRQGISTRLMQHALMYLDMRQVATISLDATPAGQMVYEKLDFYGEYTLTRYEGVPIIPNLETSFIPFTAAHMDAVAVLDQQISGMSRRRFLAHLFQEPDVQVYLAGNEDNVQGFAVVRPGVRAAFIGPCMAQSAVIGILLLQTALHACSARRCFIDIPDSNTAAIDLVKKAGLTMQRSFLRMYRGVRINDDVARIWGISGPEKG